MKVPELGLWSYF